MTILTSPSFLTSLLPPNWRAFTAHSPTTTTSRNMCTYILSPEGRRFGTVEAVTIYLTELIEAKERQEKVGNMEMIRQKNGVSIIDEEREKVARKKKKMSDRNPLRNMLKRTLKRNCMKKKSLTKQLKKQRKRH
eukprot:GFUD01103900.1.p1 GENE.GFUD01103900.1~~GFUD01103900.1.p1  ORF type:complete len:134 (-),score=49.48 GFUD01103900.1:7-408(-)